MRRLAATRRALIVLASISAVVLCLAALASAMFLRLSLPQLEGDVRAPRSCIACQCRERRPGRADANGPITLRSRLGAGLSARARALFSDGPAAPFGRRRAIGSRRPCRFAGGQGRAPASLPPSRGRPAGDDHARGTHSLGLLCRGREPGLKRSRLRRRSNICCSSRSLSPGARRTRSLSPTPCI